MPKFCTNCGKEIADGVAFCTECGTPAPAEEAASTTEIRKEESNPAPAPTQQTYTQPVQPQPVYQQPAPAVDAPPSGKYGVVGTGYFFGMMFLYAIPVIGWLVCLITAFAAKNENKKHFSRAMLIWLIIGLVLAVVGFFAFRWLGGMLTDYINAEFGGQFGGLQELLEQFTQFGDGGLIPPVE